MLLGWLRNFLIVIILPHTAVGLGMSAERARQRYQDFYAHSRERDARRAETAKFADQHRQVRLKQEQERQAARTQFLAKRADRRQRDLKRWQSYQLHLKQSRTVGARKTDIRHQFVRERDRLALERRKYYRINPNHEFELNSSPTDPANPSQ